LKERLKRRSDDRGQGLAEFALILALIAVVSIASLTVFGWGVDDVITDVGNAVSDALDRAAPGQPGHTHRPHPSHPAHP